MQQAQYRARAAQHHHGPVPSFVDFYGFQALALPQRAPGGRGVSRLGVTGVGVVSRCGGERAVSVWRSRSEVCAELSCVWSWTVCLRRLVLFVRWDRSD